MSQHKNLPKQYTGLGENRKKEVTREIDKNGQENTKNICYILLRAQDLWQAPYQIMSISFLKQFIELNVNTDMMIKNIKLRNINISIATVFLNIENLKMI